MVSADLSEREWQRVLVSGLVEQGWTVNHVGRGRHKSGDWVTPTTSPGWPDLIAVRRDRLLAVEVKGPRTPVEEHQVAWLTLFSQLPCANAWVLRPTDDWHQVAKWVTYPEQAPKVWGFDPARLSQSPSQLLAARRSARGSRGGKRSTPPGLRNAKPEQGRML